MAMAKGAASDQPAGTAAPQRPAEPGAFGEGPLETERPIKFACKGLWKVFGDGAAEMLVRHGHAPSAADLAEAGLIGAVRDATLEVGAGEIFVIMGLSGSGKSTLVRCLSRLIEPTAGEIYFEGRDLLKASAREMIELRRHKMGMVFQHFALLPHLTVLGNVAFPLEVQGVGRRTREKRALEVIELVGLAGRERYYPRELSGGQQQRVGIARSLAVEPEIWFLDEPFSALDPLIRREMQDEFLRLQKLLRKTIVFITHDFDEAIRLADRIAIMKDGVIIQVGTPEELVTRPATDYVAEFTRDVPRAKVLTARSVMRPLRAGQVASDYAGEVHLDARIAEIAAEVEAAERPFAVVDGAGERVGEIGRDDVIAVLVGRERR
ncbi:MAG: glycine betaine/L-proline ABC transporter ATP-binding protein [Kiloniellales bacterium]